MSRLTTYSLHVACLRYFLATGFLNSSLYSNGAGMFHSRQDKARKVAYTRRWEKIPVARLLTVNKKPPGTRRGHPLPHYLLHPSTVYEAVASLTWHRTFVSHCAFYSLLLPVALSFIPLLSWVLAQPSAFVSSVSHSSVLGSYPR